MDWLDGLEPETIEAYRDQRKYATASTREEAIKHSHAVSLQKYNRNTERLGRVLEENTAQMHDLSRALTGVQADVHQLAVVMHHNSR